MTVEETFKQSNLLNLASLIQDQFVGSSGVFLDRQKWSAKISGVLNLSHDEIKTDFTASCVVNVPHDWWQNLPRVHCNDYWVKKDIDFHIGGDGWICFDLDLRWKKYVARVLEQEGMKAAALYATAWCLHHCRWLLYRHRCFYVDNTTEWPKNLPQWDHGNRGRNQFLQDEYRKQHREERNGKR